jgi:hypothetical protein
MNSYASPQALCCRPLRGLRINFDNGPWDSATLHPGRRAEHLGRGCETLRFRLLHSLDSEINL